MRLATPDDLPRIVEIYNATVPLRIATADTEPVSVSDKQQWFEAHDSATRPIIVTEIHDEIVAWMSFSDFVGRPGYAKTAEISIYVDEAHRSRGIGARMLERAIDLAPELGVENLIGLVFSHNEPSLALMRSFGFEEWGTMPEIVEMDRNSYSVSILGLRVPTRDPS